MITARLSKITTLVQINCVWLILGVAACLYLASISSFQVGSYQDDALYITLARSISQGQGFRRIELIGAPETTFVPFGYPLLLAPLVYLFPHSFLPLQLLSVAFALGNLGLIWVFLRRRVARFVAILILILYATQGGIVGHSALVMSETAFIFFTMIALVLLDIFEASTRIISFAWLGLVLSASMAYFIRVPGIALVGGITVYLLLRRHFAKAIAFMVPVFSLLVLWLIRNWLVAGTLISKEYIEIAGRSGALDYVSQLLATMRGYFSILPDTLVPLLSPKILSALNAISLYIPPLFWTLVWFFVLVGCVQILQHHFGASEVYLVFMMGLLVLWGYEQSRYLLPLVPLLYLYLILGLSKVLEWTIGRIHIPIRATHIIVLGFIGILLLNMARNVQGIIQNPIRSRIPDISLGATWIREHSSPDAIVMTSTPRSTFMYAERASLPYPPKQITSTDVDARYVYTELPKRSPFETLNWAISRYAVNYLLIAPPLIASDGVLVPKLDDYMTTTVLPVVGNQPEQFRLVYENPDQQVFVYEVQH